MARIAVACISAAGNGSVAAAARQQAVSLSTEHDVYLVSDSLPEDMDKVKGIRVPRPKYHWLRRLAHVPSEMIFALRVQSVLARLDAAQPLSLVLYNNHSLLGVSFPRPLRQTPAVMVTHADIFDRPRGTYDWRVSTFYKWVARRAYSFATVVIANSKHTSDRVRNVVPEAQIEVIHVPVALSDIDGNVRPPPSLSKAVCGGRRRLLFVGRLAYEKGLDVLLDACRVLAERSFPVELVVVGDGPLADSLQSMQGFLNPDVTVEHIPWQPRSSLAAIYRSADVLCMPSRRESLGLVAVEALLCGLPVVAANIGGLREVVRDGVDGELVDSEDPVKFAEAVVRVSTSTKYRHRGPDLSWLERFSPEIAGRQLLQLAGTVISSADAR